MGAAQTSNVSQAVTNVTNYVGQNTTANTSQVNNLSNQATFQNCVVELSGDLNYTTQADIFVSNQQIIAAKNDTNLANNIQQEMLQEAASKIGALGIGYADAQNSASQLVNATSTIMQDMNAGAEQYSSTSNNFQCVDSYISARNLNISFNSKTDFLSTQTLNQQQTAQVVNDISQSITQKATATVEGIGGLLFALVLILAVMAYGFTRTLDSGSVKMIIAVILVLVLSGIMISMYIANAPPFFAQPNQCINNSEVGGCTDQCVNMQQSQIDLQSPPFRYLYPLAPGYSGPDGQNGANLLQMAIATVSRSGPDNGDNGGYRMDVANQLATILNTYNTYASNMGIAPMPNLLTNYPGLAANTYYQIPSEYQLNGQGPTAGSCTPGILQLVSGAPGKLTNCDNKIDPVTENLATTTSPELGIANLNWLPAAPNVVSWQTYLDMSNPVSSGPNDTPQARAQLARFAFCSIIGNIDLHIYIDENELVRFTDNTGNVQVGQAKDYLSYTYKFLPDNSPVDSGFGNAIEGGGKLYGLVGDCNNRVYKVSRFFQKIGGWILLGLVGIILLYMAYTWWANRNKRAKMEEKKMEVEMAELK
jgi:hypothetical protein